MVGSALRFGAIVAPQVESKPAEPAPAGPSDWLYRAGAKIRLALRLRTVHPQVIGGEDMKTTPEFEDMESRRKRKELKWDPGLVVETKKLWDTADCGMRMKRDVYMDYHTSLFCFLTGQSDLATFASKAWDAAIDDWESDTQGWDDLHYEAFHDSVFEIIDLHTSHVSRFLYVRYAKAVVRGITNGIEGKRKWRQTWPHDKRPDECDKLLAALRAEVGVQETSDSGKDQKRVARAFKEWREETQEVPHEEEGEEEGDVAPGREGKLSMEMFEAALARRLKSAELLQSLKDVAVLTAMFRRCDADVDGRLSVSDLQAVLLGKSKSTMRSMGAVDMRRKPSGNTLMGSGRVMGSSRSMGSGREDLTKIVSNSCAPPTPEKPAAPQRSSSVKVAPQTQRPPSRMRGASSKVHNTRAQSA